MKIKYFNLGMSQLWLPPKLLLIMKLIIIIMTTCLLQVSASGIAQKLTYTKKGARLEEIFKEIRKQTNYNVFYLDKKIDDSRQIDVNFKGTDLKIVLEQLTKDLQLTYTIDEKNILIKPQDISVIDRVAQFFQQDSVVFKGKVLDAFGQPLPGASVKVKGSKKGTFTTAEGNFVIYADANATLQVSYIGYETQELKLRREDAGIAIKFNMKTSIENLGEVNVVSTGYQDLPKERATGSFEIVTAKQLEHSNNPNLLRRLEGITTSMDFNNPISGNANLSSAAIKRSPLIGLTIRGKNTLEPPGVGVDLSANSGQVLVVIDGVPSPYSIDQVNPDDVESINVLKDAAAASVWGSRAANGVIVIKTKKGRFNKPLTISFNTNINLSEKIDLFYKKTMSSSDFVDIQIQKYNYYHTTPVEDPTNLYGAQPYLSPVEEILNDQALNQLSPTQAKAKLDALRGNDVRRDLDKYFLRQGLNQNYTLAIDGGSEKYAYRLSGGYITTRENTVPSSNDRYNVSYSNLLKPTKNLSFQAIISYNETQSTDQSPRNKLASNSFSTGFAPYARLADDAGNPLVYPRTYRPKFLQLLANRYGDKILDMSYRPLDDINQGYNKTAFRTLNLNLNANYQINTVFNADLTYGYNYSQDEDNTLDRVNSFYAREWINIFTSREDYKDPITGVDLAFKRIIPLGGFYSTQFTKKNTQTLRGQLNANKTWNGKHQLNAFAAIDIGQYYSLLKTQQFYGYDEKTLKSNNSLPFGMEFYRLIEDTQSGLPSGPIPFFPGDLLGSKTRTLSLFSNAAYTYDRRYTLSASIRRDLSSAAGLKTNKGGTPYISVGGLWNLANEKFYKIDWLPVLQLRATFGYNGNTNSSVPSRPTISYKDAPGSTGNMLPYGDINYVTNSELRPERSSMLNLGLDFGLKGNKLTGSVQYFVRNTSDLINDGRLDPTSGYASARYNIADLRSWGSDVTLNSINLQTRMFRWTSNLTFSYNRVKILKLFNKNPATAAQFLGVDNVEGYELSRMAAFRWAGLDPQTGDPRGYDVNGNILSVSSDPLSPNLNAITTVPVSSLRYFGSAVPVYYGAFRNTFSYGPFSITAAFQYKLGYYFRKSLSDVFLYSFLNLGIGPAEYAQRWQKSGDEKTTHVPSFAFPTSDDRDYFYRFSEVNVLKGDHIRFQEINLSYAFSKTNWFLKNPRIYANVTNLGIIWRANKAGIDPDVNDYPRPRTYGFGLSANF